MDVSKQTVGSAYIVEINESLVAQERRKRHVRKENVMLCTPKVTLLCHEK